MSVIEGYRLMRLPCVAIELSSMLGCNISSHSNCYLEYRFSAGYTVIVWHGGRSMWYGTARLIGGSEGEILALLRSGSVGNQGYIYD